MNSPTINITPRRSAIFLGSWVLAYCAGFPSRPDTILNIDTDSISYSLGEAEGYIIAAFIIGSVMLSFVDHKVGAIEPVNLRIAYVIVGGFLTIISVLTWNLVMAGG